MRYALLGFAFVWGGIMLGIGWLGERLDAYLSRVGLVALTFQVVSFVLAAVGIILRLAAVPHVTWAILILLAVINLALVVFNERLLGDRKDISGFLDFIVAAQPQQYRYTRIDEIETINERGDGTSKYTYEVEAVGAKLYWVRFGIGVAEDAPAASFRELGFRVTNDHGNQLKRFVVKQEPRRKQVIVSLHAPVGPGERYKLTMEYTWPRSWKTLLSTCSDAGTQVFRTDIEEYRFVLNMPPTHRIHGFTVVPPPPDMQITIESSGQKAEWVMRNAPKQEYRYDVACSRG